MKTICFIETTKNGSSLEAIKAASRLGFYTVLFTTRTQFLKGRNKFKMINEVIQLEHISESLIRDEVLILQQSEYVIKAIISFIDPFVSLAAQLMNAICATNISVDALSIMEDKATMRVALAKNESTPKFLIHDPTQKTPELQHYHYPMIVKSTVSKASKDVYLVSNSVEMEKRLKKLTTLYPNQQILLEEYLEGPQYLVEVLVYEGNIEIVAIFKQTITKEKKFIVTGYEIQFGMEEGFHDRIYDAVSSILVDLKAFNIACHLEMRLVNGDWKLIEVNPRLSGGAMNRMIEEAYGINLAEETIKLYMGTKPSLIRTSEKYIYAHFITIGTCGRLLKVTGESKATLLPDVKEVFVKPRIGEIVMPALSMGHRYGYVIATGHSSKEAKSNAVNASNKIKFYIEPI